MANGMPDSHANDGKFEDYESEESLREWILGGGFNL